jgi:hypothetical protein
MLVVFTVHSHELKTVKILEFNPTHFDLLVTNRLNSSITYDYGTHVYRVKYMSMYIQKVTAGEDAVVYP